MCSSSACDGLSRLPEAIEETSPQSTVQICVVLRSAPRCGSVKSSDVVYDVVV